MIKQSKASKIFDVCNVAYMILIMIITLYPFLYMASVSISDSYAVLTNRVTFYPIGFDLSNYKRIIHDERILIGYKNTIKYVVVGTLFNILATSTFAYGLSKKRLKWKRPITMLIVFTMLFSGGLIPSYLLVTKLKLYNTMWAMVLPGLISTWNLMIMKTFFEGIPDSLEESAYLDGATELQILLYVIAPLSVPIILTMMLFYSVSHWNSFFDALIYLSDYKKYPLQIFLRNIVISGEMAAQAERTQANNDVIVAEGIKAATVMVATLPILLIYPFIQKYFIKGVMIGAVKG